MEELGAGSRTEGVQALPESALELVRTHHAMSFAARSAMAWTEPSRIPRSRCIEGDDRARVLHASVVRLPLSLRDAHVVLLAGNPRNSKDVFPGRHRDATSCRRSED